MPWSISSVSEERMKFVARLLDGESMSHLCEEFGISRKTGYKIYNRYQVEGVEAFCDRSRRPVRTRRLLAGARHRRVFEKHEGRSGDRRCRQCERDAAAAEQDDVQPHQIPGDGHCGGRDHSGDCAVTLARPAAW